MKLVYKINQDDNSIVDILVYINIERYKTYNLEAPRKNRIIGVGYLALLSYFERSREAYINLQRQ